ncbi:NADH-cytochrome b5 reductase [Saitozyma podzolica]|uniref:NADH-cytochrome b5 reductase n=1 Tax=Saitozyma podzolica TaxID=1890683 RepID=A0A427Y7F2_9TREE|nr:NADH-cytochrome b5 reductase [Saitozyma podzolica]
MSLLRAPAMSRAAAVSGRSRGYASAAGGSGSNLPMILAVAGVAGLGGYVYLQRNPSIKADTSASVESLKEKAEAKVQGIQGELKASDEGPGVLGALIKCWTPFLLTKVEDYNHNTKLYTFDFGDPEKTRGGQVANALLVKTPEGEYEVKDDKGKPVISGITPMYQMITHSLDIPDDKTKWTLVFSNVTDKDILLRKEWDQLAKAHPDRLEVKYVLDKAPWGETGFVTANMIQKVFPKKDDKVMAFVCGPPGQVKALAGPKDGPRQGELQGALKELGYTAEEVFKF